jgi:hypothetical protein
MMMLMMMALEEMTIAMAMVVEDSVAVTIEMVGAMKMLMMMALEEMTILIAMVIEDSVAVTIAVMVEMVGA